MGKIYGQLSFEERTKIQMQLEAGFLPAAIALGLDRSPSTISRELRRNSWVRPKARRGPGRPPVAGGYRSEGAHGLSLNPPLQLRTALESKLTAN